MSLYLGVDLSTQSLSVCVYDSKSMEVIKEKSISFSNVPEITKSSMDRDTLLIPQKDGQAEQDPMIFLMAIDRLFEEFSKEFDLHQIKGIQFSAQQHGHIYLNSSFKDKMLKLSTPQTLWDNLQDTFSYAGAPIWRSADTQKEAEFLRDILGGKENTINITGSDSPLRFTGAVVKKIFDNNPDVKTNTTQIMLLNTYLAAIFSDNSNPKVDIGNGAGMTLMNYSEHTWNDDITNAIDPTLQDKLGALGSPLCVAGNVNSYFIDKYGFSKECLIGIGTGDNPATKMLSTGDLLSLGTSFVYMKNTKISDRDMSGVSNAMYDGAGNPFTILCRTNGAMIWDRIRSKYDKNYQDSHNALVNLKDDYPVGLWQLERESVPLSTTIELQDLGDFDKNYKALVLSNLGLLEQYTAIFGKPQNISVTGGATNDLEIVQIIADLWQCPVHILPALGASLGAALMAVEMVEKDFELDKAQLKLTTNTISPRDDKNIESYKKELKIKIKEYLEKNARTSKEI